MTYLGKVTNGVIEFTNGVTLPDGTLVRIEPVTSNSQAHAPGSAEAVAQCDSRWIGPTGEVDQLLKEVQRRRDADLTPSDQE